MHRTPLAWTQRWTRRADSRRTLWTRTLENRLSWYGATRCRTARYRTTRDRTHACGCSCLRNRRRWCWTRWRRFVDRTRTGLRHDHARSRRCRRGCDRWSRRTRSTWYRRSNRSRRSSNQWRCRCRRSYDSRGWRGRRSSRARRRGDRRRSRRWSRRRYGRRRLLSRGGRRCNHGSRYRRRCDRSSHGSGRCSRRCRFRRWRRNHRSRRHDRCRRTNRWCSRSLFLLRNRLQHIARTGDV